MNESVPKDNRKKKGKKNRLDWLMLQQGLVSTEREALALCIAGKVRINGQSITKAGALIDTTLQIEVLNSSRFVSRGGEKLASVFEQLPDFCKWIRGKTVLDMGASTGGFTDCLLQYGAGHVVAMDVGYGQLHFRLRQDSRVIVRDRINIRLLNKEDLMNLPQIDFFTADLSFISLRQVASALAENFGHLPGLIMVKPQFELPQSMNVRGVVREKSFMQQAVVETAAVYQQWGWNILKMIPSRLPGPKGNREFFLLLRPEKNIQNIELTGRLWDRRKLSLDEIGELVLKIDVQKE